MLGVQRGAKGAKDCLNVCQINQNTAEYAKNTKQTNRSDGLFELLQERPALGFLDTFFSPRGLTEECAANLPVGLEEAPL